MSNVIPLHVSRAARRQRELLGAYAIVRDEDGTTVVLNGLQLTLQPDEAVSAGNLVLALFAAGLTVGQVKDVAVTLKGMR